jgi:flagellar hook-length control protein FliK
MPLAFLPQSVAAAMAGAQGTTPPQSTAQTSGDSAESDSTDPISATAGSASQTIMASLKGPDDLKIPGAVGDPAQANGQTAPAAANTALTPDGTNAAAVAFQAHMSVSSHLQQSASTVSGDKVEAPVGTPAFNDEIGGKITWLANQGVQSASLQLSPEHLGPVNVHILVHDGSATVSFNAAHADTRTALEQALPRLREMFSTQGLTLTDASVSHQSPRGQPQKQAISSINAIGAVSDDSSATSITSVTSARLGLVDTYA